MKHSILLGLLGSLMASACGGSLPPASHVATAGAPSMRCSGSVTIRRQADVRSVAATCGAIDGDLLVVGTDVTNLDGLANIHSVRYLVVAENPKLENVRGLQGLESARGITFMDNPALRSLSGLEGLSVADEAVIANNGVQSLEGLRALGSARETVIEHNGSDAPTRAPAVPSAPLAAGTNG